MGRLPQRATRTDILVPYTTFVRSLPEDDPVLVALGISDAQGRLKPTRQAKYRQGEEFLRLLDSSITDAFSAGALRKPTAEDPLRIVDLGDRKSTRLNSSH